MYFFKELCLLMVNLGIAWYILTGLFFYNNLRITKSSIR